MFHVEKMGFDDFSFAVKLANTMDWNMTPADFELNVKLEPQGCFVLFHGRERIGILTSISFGKAGWFGNLIVKNNARRKGAGSLLIKHAVDYLKSTGVETIGLYAYPHLTKFYERLGFKSDRDFLVLKGKTAFLTPQEALKTAESQDIPELIDLDCQCFGANRRKLLELILLEKGNLCYVSTESGEITSYIAAKKVNSKMAEIGPLICHTNHVKEAKLLLKTVLNRLNGFEVFMYLSKREPELINLLYQAGLKEAFRVVRMFSGPVLAKNCIYAAESLERG